MRLADTPGVARTDGANNPSRSSSISHRAATSAAGGGRSGRAASRAWSYAASTPCSSSSRARSRRASSPSRSRRTSTPPRVPRQFTQPVPAGRGDEPGTGQVVQLPADVVADGGERGCGEVGQPHPRGAGFHQHPRHGVHSRLGGRHQIGAHRVAETGKPGDRLRQRLRATLTEAASGLERTGLLQGRQILARRHLVAVLVDHPEGEPQPGHLPGEVGGPQVVQQRQRHVHGDPVEVGSRVEGVRERHIGSPSRPPPTHAG